MSEGGVKGGWFAATGALEGLDGAAADLPLLGLPLRERQERAFLEARVDVHPAVVGRDPDPVAGPRLLVREDTVISMATVHDAVAMGRAAGRDLAFHLGGRAGAFAAELSFGDDSPRLVWLHAGVPDPARIAAAERVELDPQERLFELPLPTSAVADIVELPITERLLHPGGHWLQLLWANLLGLAPFLWRGLTGRNAVESAVRLAFAAMRAGTLDPPVLAGRLGRRGSGCRVHPSAVVEGCWLGDQVEIGAGAVVRGVVLGDGAAVEEQALVEFSVLSPGARVQRQALVKFSLLAPRAAVGGMVQLGFVDRDAQVKIGTHLMDMSVDQGVSVMVAGRRQPAPLGLAGVAVGARTLVGAGVRVAPGRAIPPDLAVLPPPEQVLLRIPDGLQGKVVVRDGALVPLDERGR
ncbi:MAG: hypothetical protein H6742_02265 [Alphaproteobacteria bacterium]|nr:hypothetical protein [Alphaproteobacteria bacterium]